jgi:hypothetical protein
VSIAWERAEIVAADTPSDKDDGAQGLTLKLQYEDGTVRYVSVAVVSMTTRFAEPKEKRKKWKENPPHGPTSERIMRHSYGAFQRNQRLDFVACHLAHVVSSPAPVIALRIRVAHVVSSPPASVRRPGLRPVDPRPSLSAACRRGRTGAPQLRSRTVRGWDSHMAADSAVRQSPGSGGGGRRVPHARRPPRH